MNRLAQLMASEIGKRTVFVAFAAGLCAANVAMERGRVMLLDGDEDCYRVMAASLVRGRFLDLGGSADLVGNERLLLDLRRVPNRVPGLPLLLAPFERAAGRAGEIVLTSLVAALLLASLSSSAALLTGDWTAALAAAGLAGLTFPILPFSRTLHPGLLAALLTSEAVRRLLQLERGAPARQAAAAAVLCVGLLPWVHLSGFALAAFLTLALASTLVAAGAAPLAAWCCVLAAAMALGPAVIAERFMLGGFGGLSAAALAATDLPGRIFSLSWLPTALPGLLLDRAKGLLPFAPVYVLGLAGLPLLPRWTTRASAAVIGGAFATHLLWMGCYGVWYGGLSLPARMLLPVVPLLTLPMAFALRGLRRSRLLWAAVVPLSAWSLEVSAAFLRRPGLFCSGDAGHPLASMATRLPRSLLLRWPSFMEEHVWRSGLPSRPMAGWAAVLVLAAALAGLAALLRRASPDAVPVQRARRAALPARLLALCCCVPAAASIAVLGGELALFHAAWLARESLSPAAQARLRRLPAPGGEPVAIDMVRVPAGVFLMGDRRAGGFESAGSSGYPARPVYVGSFLIGRREVTNAEYREFVEATGSPAPRGWNAGRFPPGQEDYPVMGISWLEAEAFSRWAGGRLPTEAEWEKAARWGPGESPRRNNEGRYPWGREAWTPEKAVCLRPDRPRVEPVGRHPAGDSRYGAQDMVGNAPEFTAGDFLGGPEKTVRGGAWYMLPSDCTALLSFGAPPDLRGDYGFRVAMSADADAYARRAVPPAARPRRAGGPRLWRP